MQALPTSHYTQCPVCADHYPTMFIQTHADRCTPATREALLARRRDAKARRLAELRVARQAGFTTQIGESTSPALGQEDQALAASISVSNTHRVHTSLRNVHQ